MKRGGIIVTTDVSIGVTHMSNCLKTLSDQTRLIMMKLFLEKEYCVCELVDMFEMSQPAISQHLRKLKKLDLSMRTEKGSGVIIQLIHCVQNLRRFV